MANTMSPHFECIAPYFQSPAERSQRVLQLRKKVKSFVYGKPRPDPDWLMHLSVETQYRFGLTDAARRGDTGAVKTLLNHGADPNSRDRQGDPAIVLAAMCNRPLVAQLLISAKADLNLCTGLGDTALIWSSWLGEFRLARILVNAGASLDARNYCHATALMFASSAGSLRIVKLLVNAGANTMLEEKWQMTAHEIAKKAGNMDIADYLRRKHFSRH